jgi:uncharacterized protein with ACT and thioredoxin-like domain
MDCGTLIHGLPVVDNGDGLEGALKSTRARYLVMTSARMGDVVAPSVRKACSDAGVEILSMNFTLRAISEVAEPHMVVEQPIRKSVRRNNVPMDAAAG